MEDVKTPQLSPATPITRRSLLKWTGLAAVGTAALGTTGCAGFNEKEPLSETGEEAKLEGEWIPCSCWADCGSKGFNKALVKDGEVVRLGTDQTHDDSPDCPPAARLRPRPRSARHDLRCRPHQVPHEAQALAARRR
ncbi:hypothetical protein [Adlercreutzia caecimuris]|uniref:hypothetical protein n=1 Tax=Adlercreutzia caecimuris TaxID=671266 RepID=UPI001364A077|nr:hypothetical protein [Adlercreutzia caecimuris]